MPRFAPHRSRRPFVTAGLLLLVVVFGAASFEKLVRDDDSQFAVTFVVDGKEVAPVRGAPLTLRIAAPSQAADDTSFDWAFTGVIFENVEDLDGHPIDLAKALVVVPDGRRVTAARVEDGVLVVDGAVLRADPAVRLAVAGETTTHPITSRTVFGLAAILAPLAAIILAVVTRQVIFALAAGVFIGMWALTGSFTGAFEEACTKLLPDSLDGDRVRILMFSGLLGSVVALVARMGGTKGIVEAVARSGAGHKRAQLTTWFAGLLVFFDDYANALLVGNTMRPITDRLRISREKLAYLVDSTSAPVACVGVISTWIATEIAYIEGKLELPAVQAATGLESGAGYQTFLATIPYNFYPILALVFGLMICLGRRDFGPMLKAERRARRTGELFAPGASPLSSKEMDELEPADPNRLKWYNAVVPILTVVFGVIVFLYVTGRRGAEGEAWSDFRTIFGNSDSYYALMMAAILGVLVASVMALGQRLMTLTDTVETIVAGIKSMVPAFLVLILAWTLQSVCERANTSQWLIHQTSFSAQLLPAIVFLLSAVVAFATGTSWGTMGIIIPLTIDYAVGLGVADSLGVDGTRDLMVAAVGGVLAGAVFGDHCSPISDTTIMSSMACGSDHVDHVRTQLPYALVVAGIALVVGYVPAGFGFSPWISLAIGAGLCAIVLRVVGTPTELETSD